MKFKLNSEELGKNIQGLAKMVSGKASLAILDHFLFEVGENNLNVFTSDGENMMRTTIDIEIMSAPESENDKRFCVHNTVICDFLKNIAEQTIVFNVNLKDCEVKISYKNGHIQFPCIAEGDFPKIHIMGGESQIVYLPSSLMLDDINRTSPFTGQETLRPVMNSICFNLNKNGLDVVSSNGGVLVKITHQNITRENENILLLPPKPITLLKYFLSKEEKDVVIRFTSNAAVFSCDNWELTCRLIEGRYPNYNSVISTNHNAEALIDKKQLQDSIRRMLPMGIQTMKVVKIQIIRGFLEISTEDPDFNKSAKEDIPCETSGEITIGVNGETLDKVLSHIPSDKAKLLMTYANRPFLVIPEEDKENESILGLLMPCMMT